MSTDAQNRLGKRLQRILLLLPYAIKHPGVSLDELARKFELRKKDLVEDLNLVYLCGLPGYGPGDLIDVAMDDEHVYIRMADYFGAPLKLTPVEALALYAGGAALVDTPGLEDADALKRALEKLGKALGTAQQDAGDVGIQVKVERDTAGHLDELNRALRERRRVHLEYLSASRGQLTKREVDPWGLITALGHWYLVGWDHLSEDERMFRLDRMKDVEVRHEVANVPHDFEPERYKGAFVGGDSQTRVTFEISPQAARWFADYYPIDESEEMDDGWTRVTLQTGGTRWAATLLLRLGADARNAEPAAIGADARSLAKEIAARHS
jgi:proteasome accessory factor C